MSEAEAWEHPVYETYDEAKVTLNDGHVIPQLGLGVWQIRVDDELRPIVPPGLEGTVQAIYGTVGIGAATALLRPELGWPGY